jgi:hypothetical protein
MGKPRYLLTLEARPLNAPAEVRLRQALKVLLRRFGFRAVKVEILSEQEPKEEKTPAAR